MAGILTSSRISTVGRQQKSTVAIVAIIAAIGGVVASFTGHPFWGMFIGLGSIVLGAVGLGLSTSSKISGGILSLAAIVLSVIGLGLSILVAVGILIF
jgi:hypothetical protein